MGSTIASSSCASPAGAKTAAHQRMGRWWEDWWRTHAGAGTEPWQPEPARTGDWAEVPEPMRSWKAWGVPLVARHDGPAAFP